MVRVCPSPCTTDLLESAWSMVAPFFQIELPIDWIVMPFATWCHLRAVNVLLKAISVN